MPQYTFTGDQSQTYPQYLDVGGESVSTLVAEPGGTYDIAQADGLTAPGELDKDGNPTEPVGLKLPMPPDDRWKAAQAGAPKPAKTENEER
jgi:hypothetical protein